MWEMNPGQLARYREAVAGDRPGAELEGIVAGLERKGDDSQEDRDAPEGRAGGRQWSLGECREICC
jgi:hypothetical protein